MRLYLLSAAVCGRINERKSNMKSLVFALAAVAVSAAFAEGPKMWRQPPAESMNPIIRAVQNPKIAAKLGLSEEQAAKLKTLAERQEELKGLQEKVRKGMEWQAELLKAKEVDRAAVMSAFDEVWAARKEIAKLQMSRLITVKSILTDEQVAKVREALQTMRNNPKGLKGDEPKVRKGDEPKGLKDGEPKVRNRDGVKVRRGCKGAKCDPKPEAKQE